MAENSTANNFCKTLCKDFKFRGLIDKVVGYPAKVVDFTFTIMTISFDGSNLNIQQQITFVKLYAKTSNLQG